MTDDEKSFSELLAEATAKVRERHYECTACGETFDSGRDARQHCKAEHGTLSVLRTRRG